MKPFEIHGKLKVKTRDLSIEFLAALRARGLGDGVRESIYIYIYIYIYTRVDLSLYSDRVK